MDYTFQQTCLICNNYVDRKPSLDNQEGDGNGSKFWKTISLFFKLVELESEVLEEFGDGEPCCGTCWASLAELQRLQDIIEESQILQQEVVETLKASVTGSVSGSRNLMKLRLQLIKTVVQPRAEVEGNFVGDDDFDFCDQNQSTSESESDENVQIKARIQTRSQSRQSPPKRKRGRSPKPCTNFGLSSSGPPALKECSVRLKRIKLDDFPNLKIRGLLPQTVAAHKNVREVPEDYELRVSASMHDEIFSDVEEKPEQNRKQMNCQQEIFQKRINRVKGTSNSYQINQLGRLFYLINDETLMFLCTTIKSESNGFTCLEPSCNYKVKGRDFFAFEKMKDHIIQCHEKEYETEKISRLCPICSEDIFETGYNFRMHVFRDLTRGRKTPPRIVVCESCWKPIHSSGHPLHVWKHKNAEEKAATLQSGDGVTLKVINKYEAEEKKRLKAENRMKLKSLNSKRSKLDSSITTPRSPTQYTEIPKLLRSNKRQRRRGASKKGRHNCKIPRTPRINQISRLFFLINDTTLMFLCTCIKSEPNGFTCQEPDCSFEVEGRYFFAFEEMKDHISQCHEKDYQIKKISRPCPVCPKAIFETGYNFRTHVFQHLARAQKTSYLPRIVICEICWRPVHATNHPLHVWKHKNAEEKATSIQRGDGVTTNVKKKHEAEEKRRLQAENRMKLQLLMSKRRLEKRKNQKSTKSNITGRRRRNYGSSASKMIKSDGTPRTYRISQLGRVFYLINDETLMFLCTSIKFDPNGFTCLEPHCGYEVEGKDFFAFENMKDHITQCHVKSYQTKKVSRSCPICSKTIFHTAYGFRTHVFADLARARESVIPPRVIVCESCWKPIHYTNYSVHTWKHKSDEEKLASVKNGENIDSKLKVKVARTMGIVFSDSHEGDQVLQESQMPHLTPKRSRFKPNNIKDGDFFYLLNTTHLYHKGVVIQHTGSEFICKEDSCSYSTPGNDYFSFENFKEHVNSTHNTILDASDCRRRSCPACNEEFTDMSSFRNHIFSEHKPPAVCISCWRPLQAFNMERHFKSHSKIVVGPKKRRRRYGKEKETPKTVKNEVKYQCSECPKQFKVRAFLKYHQELHLPRHLRKKFKCPDCPLEVLSPQALRSHISRAHKPELAKKRRECPICSRSFHYRDGEAFRTHVRRHTGETPWICDICGKGFASHDGFQKHKLRVHSTLRAYQCEFCEMNYKHPFNLRRHQLTAHKGLVKGVDEDASRTARKTFKPENLPGFIGPKIAFPCEICGMLFKLRSRMTKHVRLRHGENQ